MMPPYILCQLYAQYLSLPVRESSYFQCLGLDASIIPYIAVVFFLPQFPFSSRWIFLIFFYCSLHHLTWPIAYISPIVPNFFVSDTQPEAG